MTAAPARALLAAALPALFAVSGDAGAVAASAEAGEREPAATAFAEMAWPFHIDQWGTGRAFRCAAASCGAQIDVYLRAKVGFCNCTKGVSDDDEIDRVGDTALIEGSASSLATGHAVTVGFLRGRTRPFEVASRFAATRFVLEVALNNKCDAVVATAVAAQPMSDAQQTAVLAFLGGGDVQRWAADNTGSETQ